MECKECWAVNIGPVFQVLIETLWNVKPGNKKAEKYGFFVLIETLWNVKEYIMVTYWDPLAY